MKAYTLYHVLALYPAASLPCFLAICAVTVLHLVSYISTSMFSSPYRPMVK